VARLTKPGEAKTLELPGRISREIVSGAHGGSVSCTLRHVEIPAPRPGEPERGRHCHDTHEECIHVLSGRGLISSGQAACAIETGDTVLIPSGEMHVTHNTGSEPLVLLCFFPVAQVAMRLEQEPTA
jgi:mannose-6-phosphate isomerase-like protein (cupin superfamily)